MESLPHLRLYGKTHQIPIVMRTLVFIGLAFTFHLSGLFAQMPIELVPLTIESSYSAPAFPGGEEELASFISERLEYPELAIDYSVEGTVVMKLTLGGNGEVQTSEVVQSLGFGCEEAAQSVIDQMPSWRAATRGSRAQESVVFLPIRFRLR